MSTSMSTGAPKTSLLDANALALISALVVVDSLHFVVGRALIPYLHPAVSSLYLMGTGCIVVGAFALWRGRLSLGVLRDHLWFFLAIGFLVGSSTVLTFGSMRYIDPGTGSMLAKLSILISIGMGVLWLGEHLNRRQVAGAVLAFVGVVTITFQPGEYLRLGSLMVVVSTIMYALHTAVVKKYGGNIEFLSFFFFRLLATSAILAVFVAMTPAARGNMAAAPNVWLLILFAGIVDVAVSRGLYYIALRRFPMSIHAIILTLSPAATILWSYFLFATYPGPAQVLGGVLVLAGVLIAMLNQE